MEGNRPHIGTVPKGHDKPLIDFKHSDGFCAIIGGYVYRGASAIPDLAGAYIYGDLCLGQLRAFDPSAPKTTDRPLGEAVSGLRSFGRDNDGEIYVIEGDGTVSKIVAEL